MLLGYFFFSPKYQVTKEDLLVTLLPTPPPPAIFLMELDQKGRDGRDHQSIPLL